MSVPGSAREWYYVESVGSGQKGPVPGIVLVKLLEKGIGVSGQTLVWKAGLESWVPMSDIDPFQSVVKFHAKQWYYMDSNNQQSGPISSRLLMHKMKQGDIDGLTLVFGDGLTEWTRISEVPDLRNEMVKITMEEQAAEEAVASLKESEEARQQQVFVGYGGLDEDPSIPLFSAPANSTHKVSSSSESNEKKSFVADNGIKYGWDEAEQDWIELDEDDEDPQSEDRSQQQQASSQKRKADTDEADGGGDDADSDDNNDSASTSNNNEAAASALSAAPKKKRNKKKKNRKLPATWIYVTGLPRDVSAEELKDHFSKVGLIALSPYDQQPYIKIYRDELSGECKGDCSLCFNSEESVKTAVDFLDGGYIRPTHQISVKPADFSSSAGSAAEHSTSSGAPAHRKAALSHAQIKVAKSAIKQALTWNEDDDIGVSKAAALRIVVLEGMFSLQDFEESESFAEELEADVAGECGKCGPIEKITVFSKNPRGVVIVKFGTSYAAQECIKLMNGRYFGGRRIKCIFWDGVTNHSIVGSAAKHEEVEEQQEESRLHEFGDWLDQDQEELPEEFRLRTE